MRKANDEFGLPLEQLRLFKPACGYKNLESTIFSFQFGYRTLE